MMDIIKRMKNILTNTTTKPMKESLKQIYIALAKAIEEGDNLKIGIVIGQTLKELEDLINQP
jgi:hypothetical protein